ncbi:peroxidasin-like [Pocillopora damicornis]|uniref:peroxidasin-like n=1 Tax=Pocillopora damicornis TaxID=46731 RepID=UPI000F5526C8|nr:peroxidasin-like [Pocillopora damicornis]
MRETSFIARVLLLFAALEVRCSSYVMQSSPQQDLADTLLLPNCNRLNARQNCIRGSLFRTFDGTCNNLCNITNGAAGSSFLRLDRLDPPNTFQQPGNLPRVKSVTGGFLRNARNISRIVFKNTDANVNNTAPNFTHVTMTWGQFLDHDLTLTRLVPGIECGVNNAPCEDQEGCTNIDILEGDELLNNKSARCIPLRRAKQNNEGEQMNDITAYIDASQVYGSDKETAESLRDQEDRRFLDVTPVAKAAVRQCGLLPDAEKDAFCRSPNPKDKPCYRAGDERVNENQALMAMHTLWVREHNRIAKKLIELNPKWEVEKVFQVTRKIVAAQLQHITYNEWLKVLFSDSVLEREGLLLEPPGKFFMGYNASINAGILNHFGTAVLRVGHTLIRSSFGLITNSRVRRSSKLIYRGRTAVDFFNPAPLLLGLKVNLIGEILYGLVNELAQLPDKNFVDVIRERVIIEGPTIDGIVGDLPAINIHRGRDHGLQTFVKFREICGAGPSNNFGQLRNTINRPEIMKLRQAYENAKDIDLFVGGILEFPTLGSVLGFTFTCLMTKQFRHLRHGDRFWYERNDPIAAFTLPQLEEIRKTSLSRVYCDNTDNVIFIQKNAFKLRTGNNGDNPVIDCDFIPRVNLEVFGEEEEPIDELPGMPIVQDCPQDFVPFRGGCIRFFLTPTITFEAARSFCMSFKTKDNKLGDLIEIRSLEENAEVVYLAPDNGQRYYIGVTDLEEEGVFRLNGDTNPAPFLNFPPGFPQDLITEEQRDCVVLATHPDTTFSLWYTVPCTNSWAFICECEGPCFQSTVAV